MTFLQVLNLRVFWDKATGVPFIDAIVPITEDKPLLEVISEEVHVANQENSVDFERDIRSVRSLSNKDVSRLLKFPTSVLFKQLVNDPLVELTIVIDRRARPDSTATSPKAMNNKTSSTSSSTSSSRSSAKNSSKEVMFHLSTYLSDDSSAVSIATEKHGNGKTDETKREVMTYRPSTIPDDLFTSHVVSKDCDMKEEMSHLENDSIASSYVSLPPSTISDDSFKSNVPKDDGKKIFARDLRKMEGSRASLQPPPSQLTKSNLMEGYRTSSRSLPLQSDKNIFAQKKEESRTSLQPPPLQPKMSNLMEGLSNLISLPLQPPKSNLTDEKKEDEKKEIYPHRDRRLSVSADRAKKEMSHLLVSDESFTSYVSSIAKAENEGNTRSKSEGTTDRSKSEGSYPLHRTISDDDSFASFASIMSKAKSTGTADGAKREMAHRPASPSIDSFTSYASKDDVKNIFAQDIFAQDPPKMEGTRSFSQPPPLQPTKSNMTMTESNGKTDKTNGEIYHHRTPSVSSQEDFTSMIAETERSNISRVNGQMSMSQQGLSRSMPQISGLKMEEMKNIMDEEHYENEELINLLTNHVGKRVVNSIERKKLLNHWEYEATRLSMKCRTSSGKSIQDIEDWKRIQWERIASMSQQEDMTAPAESPRREVNGERRFAYRASLDPSFKASLERAATTSKDKNEQIRAEAKIEIVAINECLAMRAKEKVELNNELGTMSAILKSTYSKKAIREHLLFELSCQKCNKHMSFVGKTTNLRNTTQNHFDQVVKAVQMIKSTKKGKTIKVAQDTSNGPKESWSSKFAQHFAEHCVSASTQCVFIPSFQNTVREKRILEFCEEYVKVEVLQLQDGSELFWEEMNLPSVV